MSEMIERVARAIYPEVFGRYDTLKAKGTLAANGRLWADVTQGVNIQYAKEQAIAAIMAMRVPTGNMIWPVSEYEEMTIDQVERNWITMIDAALGLLDD